MLLSQTTRDLVEHDLPAGVSLRDLGAHRLKDLQQKSHLAVGMHPLGLAFWRLLVHDIHRNLFSGFSIAHLEDVQNQTSIFDNHSTTLGEGASIITTR